MLIYYPDRHKTQRMCDEAIDDCLAALKFVPDWFVTIKMLEKFHDALNATNDRLSFHEDFSKVTFLANQMGILGVYLDKNNLDEDNNFDEDDPETIIHVRILALRNKFEKRKTLKKDISKELMPVARHPTRCWDWCLSEDEKKEIEPTFTNKGGNL